MTLRVPDSAVFAELERQRDAGAEFVNATALWHASGRMRNKSPRAWFPKEDLVHDPGGSADMPIMVAWEITFDYVQVLDYRIMMAVQDAFMERVRKDPARAVMGCPDNPMMGLVAALAVMQNEGVSPDEAADHLVAEVVNRTSELDEFSQETEVAKAQRSVELARKAIQAP